MKWNSTNCDRWELIAWDSQQVFACFNHSDGSFCFFGGFYRSLRQDNGYRTCLHWAGRSGIRTGSPYLKGSYV
jgi:hypothetical protein